MKYIVSSLFFGFLGCSFLFAQSPLLPPPPPTPPPVEEVTTFPDIEETVPYFPGCEHLPSSPEKRKCAERKMLEFLYSNLKYPKQARKKKCEGTVYISYVIEKDGSLSNQKIVRDIGCGCGEEALRVVKAMPNWEPGTQRGRPVRVIFNLPIKFRLE